MVHFDEIEYLTKDGAIEVRVGQQQVGQTYGYGLTTNDLCGRFEPDDATSLADDGGLKTTKAYTIPCGTSMSGQYLSIQKMALGVLEISAISSFPEPGKQMCVRVCVCVWKTQTGGE